jgi:hypothetical protein
MKVVNYKTMIPIAKVYAMFGLILLSMCYLMALSYSGAKITNKLP